MPLARREIQHRFGDQLSILNQTDESLVAAYSGRLKSLLALRQVVAVYHIQHFDIPRPKALLGHQHFHTIIDRIKTIRSLHAKGLFETFRISAAGENSAVFARLKSDLREYTGLDVEMDADLVLRVRPSTIQDSGWEVLIRLSPRPLSTRAWRVTDMHGALNATLAAAMIELTKATPDDHFLNLMCGSGTLLIERLLKMSAQTAVGIDIDPEAISASLDNLNASHQRENALLSKMDATRTAFPPNTFNAIVADLPYGQQIGSPEENPTLYAATLQETARIATPKARFVTITHHMKSFEAVLKDQQGWHIERTLQVNQGGLHPKIYVLTKS